LQGPLYDAQVFIEKMVNFLEVMSNIWNFSDIRASVVFYGFLGAFTVFATFILVVFSVRPLYQHGSLF
jgi:fluoride ion exporter CrcB/FEX